MRTVADIVTKINDCRRLKLAVHFFSLCEEQVDQLAREYYQFINESFQNDCVLDWSFEDHSFLDLDTALNKRKMKNGAYGFWFTGYLKSDIVYNKTTLRKFERQIDNKLLFVPTLGTRWSVDFSEYYSTMVLSQKDDSELYKRALLNLFDLEDRIYQGEMIHPDMQGLFSVTPVAENSFFGAFDMNISCYSLENELDDWANRMFDFGVYISERFPNVNAYVDLNSTDSPYTEYYGRYIDHNTPIPQQGLLLNYLRSFYNTEIGWGHIICDKTRKLGLTLTASDNSRVLCKELSSGAIAIRSNVPIGKYSICDRKVLKKCIYNTVMPRQNTIHYDWKLRRYWEYVPVFEDEVFITKAGVKFQHYGEFDTDFLCRETGIDLLFIEESSD